MHKLDAVDAASLRTDVPAFRAGDTVKVHVKVIEGTRSRIQVFQGVVIRRHGGGVGETFTVRKVSFGVGVAKLYYLRDLRGKAAKIKEKRETVPAGKGAARGRAATRVSAGPPATAPAVDTVAPQSATAGASGDIV